MHRTVGGILVVLTLAAPTGGGLDEVSVLRAASRRLLTGARGAHGLGAK